ncbi:MAG TPA: histidine kinase N-terminal domain-containing protein [Acidimicrobiales bacterium]|nr:histidine kinase N-terminal domain-containing protein [Acidimicrobiales bacterium]
MRTPAALAAAYTFLDPAELDHLQRLMVSWGVLADLSFSDLLLLAPARREGPDKLVVMGQTRPTTGATLLRLDLVGTLEDSGEWPWAVQSLQSGHIVTGVAAVPTPASSGHAGAELAAVPDTGEVPAVPETARIECVPVRFADEPIAVMVRVGALEGRRRTGRLERVYRDLYQRLVAMMVTGDYPFAGEEFSTEDAPRVGDGLLVADAEGRFEYASPNAMSALHRMGVSDAVEGSTLVELGVDSDAVERAVETGAPVIEEVERRPDVIVVLHCTPLLAEQAVTGVMVLMRDVTDLRRLDRLLLSKDAAIREVHHRVKNNLQTISSLLRLQARRLEPGKGREALREAERRVRSIALVHEILSREPGDEVPFDEIVGSLVRMTEDSVVSSRPVEIRVSGDLGEVPADVATPLAVALAELLQNAVEHAFGDGPAAAVTEEHPAGSAGVERDGHVSVQLANDGYGLTIEVRDDGRGLPAGFDIEATNSLGLSIVRDLIRSQLGGMITMRSNGGTVVDIDIPLRESDGRPAG